MAVKLTIAALCVALCHAAYINKDNRCPPSYSGYVTHESDPGAYLACHMGEAALRACREGQIFDSEDQRCVSRTSSDPLADIDKGLIPELGATYPNGCPVDYYITYLTAHPDCSSYYSCVNGEKIEQFCFSGLLFSYQQQACVWSWEADCRGGGAEGNPSSSDSDSTESEEDPEPESAVPELGETHPNGCPVDYYIDYLTPHEDCSLYYSCVHGKKVTQKCHPWLFFNFRQQSCVWAWQSDCRGGSGGGSPPDAGTEPGNPANPAQPEPESAIPELGETHPNGCPVDYLITYLTPHPVCSLYNTCVHGAKVAQNCQSGLEFSYREQACVWPWESDCKGGSPPDVGTEPGNPDSSEVPVQPEPESAIPELGETHPNGCPVDYNITYLTPHQDCRHFYSCVHGNKVAQTCVPGLLFNYRQQVCVWPWESDCEGDSSEVNLPVIPGNPDSPTQPEPESAIPDLGETLPNGCPVDYYITYLTPHQDCSLYYTCIHGDKIAQKCYSGLSFNYRQQACVWPWESDCRGDSPPDAGTEPGSPGNPEVPAQPEPESAIPELGETHPNGCPVDYYITYLTPHENCRRYYSCVHGNQVAQTCVPGLFFNYRQQVCVWPWESDCRGSSVPVDPGNPGNPDSPTQPEPESAIPELGETYPNGCPVDYYITYLTPHEVCSLYYTCVYGEKLAQSCQPGLWFNYRQQACVWTWESDCTGSSGGGSPPETGTEPSNPGNPGVPTLPEPEPEPAPEPESAIPELGETYLNGCPVNYNITYLTPHEDCSLYYSCVHGKKVTQKCQPSLSFSYRQQACVWAWESDCRGGSPPDAGTEPGNPGSPDVPAQPEPESALPELGETHPNGCPVDYYITYLTPHQDCSLYYTCVHGNKITQNCQPSLSFSYNRQACVYPWESDCRRDSGGGNPPDAGTEPGNPGNPDIPTQPEPESAIPELGETHPNGCPLDYYITYLTPHQDCSLYYTCVYGKKVAQKCVPGLSFNYRQQICTWPWESDCRDGSGSNPPDAGAEPGSPGTPEVPAQPETESAIPELGETYANGCPVDYYITYLTPHQDCSHYYTCVYGEKISQKCQFGLFFNYRQQACAWPWESDCRGGSPPDAGAEPGEPGNPDTPVQPEPESAVPELGEVYPNGCPVNHYITYLTPHEDCQLYYTCVYGNKVAQKCVPGLFFNYRQQVCSWSWESECRGGIDGGSPPDAGAEPGNPGNPDLPAQPESESTIPELGETYRNGCPVDYYITYLTPHQDCSLYYTCVNGEKISQKCQPGLSFSYRQQACVWAWESDCKIISGGGSQPGSGAESGSPDSGAGAENPVEQPPSAIPDLGETNAIGCPTDYYITYLTPHPVCSNYYTCAYGEKFEQSCPPGLLFNYQRQACVWPWESSCTEGGASAPPNPDVTEGPAQPEPESNIPELGETNANGCPIDYYITYLTPHPVCSNYYTCVYGDKVEQPCQPGLLFNYRLQSCVWPEESDCVNRQRRGRSPGN